MAVKFVSLKTKTISEINTVPQFYLKNKFLNFLRKIKRSLKRIKVYP